MNAMTAREFADVAAAIAADGPDRPVHMMVAVGDFRPVFELRETYMEVFDPETDSEDYPPIVLVVGDIPKKEEEDHEHDGC